MPRLLAKWWKIGVLLWVVSTLGNAGVARAAQGDAEPARKEWYGAPILIGGGIGGAALGAEAIIALHGNEVSPAIWVPTAALYLLTGPIVHLTHHAVGKAFASVGIDVGAPLGAAVVAVVALLLEPNCDHGLPHEESPNQCSRAVPLGVFEVGFLVGPLLDGLVLARHVHPPEVTERPQTGFSLSPVVLPAIADSRGRGLTVGIAGTF